jgi:hypothetical protein
MSIFSSQVLVWQYKVEKQNEDTTYTTVMSIPSFLGIALFLLCAPVWLWVTLIGIAISSCDGTRRAFEDFWSKFVFKGKSQYLSEVKDSGEHGTRVPSREHPEAETDSKLNIETVEQGQTGRVHFQQPFFEDPTATDEEEAVEA